jgi:hypothetical protein
VAYLVVTDLKDMCLHQILLATEAFEILKIVFEEQEGHKFLNSLPCPHAV